MTDDMPLWKMYAEIEKLECKVTFSKILFWFFYLFGISCCIFGIAGQ